MAKHVISTLGADTRYAGWVENNGLKTMARSVLVKGGAGVAKRGRGDPVTPNGVITHLSDEDAAFLSSHRQFKEHQEKGFVKIVNVARDPDTVAQTMTKDDGSRPRNEADVRKLSKKDGEDSLQALTNKK